MTGLYILIAIVALVVVGVVIVFNQLVSKRNMAINGWADIDVQLKRRTDLIPKLVAIVQGYAEHERDLFEDVIAKRNSAQAAGDDPDKRGSAESALARPVTKLLAVAEDYPDLKANENFLDLQNELSDTENKIEMARRFYNGAVRELNTLIESVPSNFVAGLFGFKQRTFFEIGLSDRSMPQIDLGAD
ncbi:MAG: LemA family protein [Henriciella sp.]